jgi:hypothetical protein
MAHREVFKYSPKYSYNISMDRTCYLDTSVIRRRIKTLRNSPLSDISYTSALTFLELITHSRKSEKEFRISKLSIESIYASDLEIDWRFPEAQVLSALKVFRPKADIFEIRTNAIQEIVRLIRLSISRSDFCDALKESDISPDIEYFENYKKHYGDGYLLAAKDARKKSQSTFKPNLPSTKILGLPPNTTHDEYTRALQGSKLNFGISLYAHTETICDQRGINDRKNRRLVFASYDGSIDSYFRALGWWQAEQSLGRTAGKNDSIDLAHLLYLFNDAHFVTSDTALAKCAKAVGVSVIGPNGNVVGAS